MTMDHTKDRPTTLAKDEHFPPLYSVPYDMLVLDKMAKQAKFILVPSCLLFLSVLPISSSFIPEYSESPPQPH